MAATSQSLGNAARCRVFIIMACFSPRRANAAVKYPLDYLFEYVVDNVDVAVFDFDLFPGSGAESEFTGVDDHRMLPGGYVYPAFVGRGKRPAVAEHADADNIGGKGSDIVATWKGKSDVGHLAGRTIKLKFYSKNVKLFGFQFVE